MTIGTTLIILLIMGLSGKVIQLNDQVDTLKENQSRVTNTQATSNIK